MLALRKAVGLFDPDDGSFVPLASIEAEAPRIRLNDGKVGPDGAFFVSSLDDTPERAPVGTLYRVDASGRVEAKVSEREQAGRTVYRVRAGPFDVKDDADALKGRLDSGGLEAALVRVQR